MNFELRLHGRGGQGVVTLAELAAMAAFDECLEVLAFPSFGSERMGAPVVSYCRISDQPIRLREPVTRPDLVVVCDATLLHQVDLFSGLNASGQVLINSPLSVSELGLDELSQRLCRGKVSTVAASALARQYTSRALPGSALLGACAALTDMISIESVKWAIGTRFAPAVAAGNVAAAAAAYDLLVRQPVASRA